MKSHSHASVDWFEGKIIIEIMSREVNRFGIFVDNEGRKIGLKEEKKMQRMTSVLDETGHFTTKDLKEKLEE